MKLEEAARKAIELLREAGDTGIYNTELAQKLKVPKRRIYDIVNPLKPLGLVEIKKERGKTKVYWSAKKESVLKQGMREPMGEEDKKLKIDTVKLVQGEQIIEPLSEESMEEGFKFNCQVLKISCNNPLKTCKVYHNGLEVVIETDDQSLIVKPDTLKPKTPKIKTIF